MLCPLLFLQPRTQTCTQACAHTSAGMHYTLSGLVRKYARNLHEITRLGKFGGELLSARTAFFHSRQNS